jgi:FkbM family methyltransferase
MLDALRTVKGVVRSLAIYYGNRQHGPAMRRLYSTFVKPGDLVFDIGAHVGDRIGAFRRLGARVVAAEPQPALIKTLRLIYGRDKSVTLVPAAVGGSEGSVEFKVNVGNPTVSTASRDFVASAANAVGWEGQAWTRSLTVPMTTLDALIARHGVPSFIKIDVEGFEDAVLSGLSRPVTALSFEFTTMQRDVAYACLDRCAALGYTRFNFSLGESQRLGDWRSAAVMRQWLADLPDEANSGDVYAAMR